MTAVPDLEGVFAATPVVPEELDRVIRNYLGEGGRIDHIAWAVERSVPIPKSATYKGYPVKFTTFAPNGDYGVKIMGSLED